jgi:hypothetical protein
MEARELMDRLRNRGITLTTDGDQIHFDGPPGTVTPDLLSLLKARKAELLELLEDPHEALLSEIASLPLEEQLVLLGHLKCVRCGHWRHKEDCRPLEGKAVCRNDEECRAHPSSTVPAPPDHWKTQRPWPPEAQELIDWFEAAGPRFPTEPFRLTAWIEVTNPATFYQRLHGDIRGGAAGPRARALPLDLQRLRDVVETLPSEVPAGLPDGRMEKGNNGTQEYL